MLRVVGRRSSLVAQKTLQRCFLSPGHHYRRNRHIITRHIVARAAAVTITTVHGHVTVTVTVDIEIAIGHNRCWFHTTNRCRRQIIASNLLVLLVSLSMLRNK